MLVIKIPLKIANKVQEFIRKDDLSVKDYDFYKDKENLYLAVNESKEILNKFPDVKTSKKELTKRRRTPTTLKEALKDDIPKELLSNLKTAFDTVGDIAIIEVDEELKKYEKIIATKLLEINKQLKVVTKKEGIHGGTFRTQKLKVLAGEERKETIYTENNCRLKLNVEEVYFSPRLSTERKRIMKLVKKGENILVMFCGCAPYPCVLAKNSEARHITGIEINPQGHKYGLENIKLNKLTNVDLINADATKVMPLEENNKPIIFDRILMPLPKSAEDFLDAALSNAGKNTIIHFYDFLHESEFHLAIEKIEKACKRNKLKHEVIGTYKCGNHAPRVFRICVDFKIK
ncbi:class I SAM-dependent methyltransferase family protein [Candidatus Woesearchaeota archaeon]|jgi:tRNA (guanine37-N1)-methyltransferase|nr:class I SAM-dependent methyltransferase family protein [Candidatus Woesearchaeota archaeon]MBT3537296.1 class I SAM-dependent methyltransferase family protein [Candidatus Woesearchaeota archaeon]MBT4696755.1 class I SAM-dependent methyltransferase family protein [Candidatus Woesearchaeota archaeon]MBT4716738.1 class I SAM-dependent methyltransferase family protein [Candidatus Woesearchaeota archaeon]MBT7106394.1 class I SAM-dependent methyltransferase family protein [Candidatus Woesearchaeot